MVGQRADTAALEAAANAQADTSGIEALMGQQNQARGLFDELYNQDVTTGLQDAIRFATDDALQNVNSLYAQAGRTGPSAAYGRAVSEGTARAAAPILMQQAQADRAARFRAADAISNMFNQDRAFDGSMASQALGAQMRDLDRGLSGAQSLTQADLAGLQNDMAAQQYAATMQGQDLNREAQLANQIAGYSQAQAGLNAARQGQDIGLLNMLERSGAAQQGQAQAELMGDQQYVNDLRAAQQQQYQNMLAAAGLGGNYVGSVTTQETPKQEQGGGLFNTIAGLGSMYLGAGAPGLSMIPGIGAPLQLAATTLAGNMFR